MVNVQRLDDSPYLDGHEEVKEAWQRLWKILGRLAELQGQAKQVPALTSAALALGSRSGVLSARDVWRPVNFMQELYVRQASGVHRTYGSQISQAAAEGSSLNRIQADYRAELDRVKESLERFPPLLELD